MPDSQQQINYGNSANDGTGDPLRTAFIKVDDNFDAIWNAGPVGSNITVLNNTISSVNVNGNIALNPNGIGMVLSAGTVAPALSRSYDLGTANLRWRTIYANSITANNITYNGNVFTGNLEGNVLFPDGETLLINNVTGAITANSAVLTGNVTANYFIGDGSLLTGITGYANTDAVAYAESGWAGNIIPSGNAVYSLGNATNQWKELHVSNTTIYIGGVALGITGNTLTVAGEPVLSNDSADSITTTGNITANSFIGDGSQLTGLPAGYTDANVAAYLPTYGGNILVDVVVGNTANNLGYLQWEGNSSGDLNGYTTLRLVPDDTLVSNDQYLIVDPTAPNHIHIRAGGTQDDSQAELYLGGEANYVQVADGTGVRLQNQTRNDIFYNYSDPTDFNTGTWYESGGTFFVQYTTVNAELINVSFQFNDDNENTLRVYYNGGANNAVLTSAGSVSNLGGGVYRVSVNQAPPANPTAISEFEYEIWSTRTNSVTLSSNDFTVDVTDDLRITGNDIVSLRNRSTTDPITIRTDYDGADRVWEFAADGTLNTPGDIVVNGDITGTAGSSTLVVRAEPGSNTAIQLNDTVDSEIRTVANLEIRTDVSNTAQVWQFGIDGVLTAPGNISATNFIGNVAAANVTGLATVATTGSYDDLSDRPTVPTLGNFTLTNNTIQTGNGVSGITLSIFGPDQGVPDPAFIMREWQFANTGAFTSPGNVSAPNFLGNIAAANVVGTVSSATTAGTVTTAAQPNITSVGTLTSLSVSGNITGGNVLTDGYFYANGDPFVSSDYSDSNVVTLLSSFGSNTISTTGNVTAGTFIGNFEITGNVTGTSANVDLIADTYQWTFDNTGNLTLPGNTFAVNYANGTAVALGGSDYGNANVEAYLPTYTGNLTPGNILTDNYLYANGDPFTAGTTYSAGTGIDITEDVISVDANVVLTSGSQNIATTGNITGGNLISTIGVYANVDLVVGDIANTSATKTRFVTEAGYSYIQTGNGTAGTTGNIVFSPYADPTQQVVIDTSTGNVTVGNITTTNITGTAANVTITANSYVTTFDTTGLATFPGAVQLAVYANTTVRDAAITSPAPGMMIYVTGTGMQVRGETQWNTITGSGT